MDITNHKINPQILASWLDGREEMLLQLTPEDRVFFAQLRKFIRHRPAYLRKLMQQYCGSPLSYPCRVIGLNAMTDRIDGYPVAASYKSWYFNGSDITETIGSQDNRRPVKWFANGKPVNRKHFNLGIQ
jgi:hypothetical protein